MILNFIIITRENFIHNIDLQYVQIIRNTSIVENIYYIIIFIYYINYNVFFIFYKKYRHIPQIFHILKLYF